MSTNLFIIGNGFDRALQLPTDYRRNLKPILKNLDESKFEKINKLYFQDDEELWSEFENHVGNIKDESLIDESINYITEEIQRFNSEYSDPFIGAYGIESENYGASDIEVGNVINSISINKPSENTFDINFQELKNFVDKGMRLMIGEANIKINTLKQVPQILNLRSNSMFLTFNYTSTLEKIYKISSSRIFHIHGTLDDELIYGNNDNKISEVDKNRINIDFNNDYLEIDTDQYNIPYNLNDFVDSVNYSEEEQEAIKEKISEEINEENMSFIKDYQYSPLKKWLDSLSRIEKIIILGHSLGEVDKSYFEMLNIKFPKAKWIVSFYKNANNIKKNAEELSFYSKINFKEFGSMVKV